MEAARTARDQRGVSALLAHLRWGESPSGIPSAVVSLAVGTVVLALPLLVLDGPVSPYFDPKAWALHLLVAAAAVAWLFHRSRAAPERGDGSAEDPATRVLRWSVLAYAAWWLVATLASITLGTSVWGNFGRADGLLTRLAAIALFFLVQAQFRSPHKAGFLRDLALLGSVPVVLLGLGQAIGLDPLPQVGDPATLQQRVRSTLGQHVFLGSYLVLIIPLAAARLAGFGRTADLHSDISLTDSARRGSARRAAGEPSPRIRDSARRAAGAPEPRIRDSARRAASAPEPRIRESARRAAGAPEPGIRESARRAAGAPEPRIRESARRAAGAPEPGIRDSARRAAGAPATTTLLILGGAWVLGALVLITLGSRWPSAWWGLLVWAIVGAGAWTRWAERGRPNAPISSAVRLPAGTATLVVVGALLAGQVATVIVSGARAAFLGTLVGLSVTAGALAVSRRAWRSLALGAGVLVAVLVLLLALNLPGSPLHALFLKAPSSVQRLGHLADLEQGSGRFRLELWRGILSGWARQARGEDLIPGGWIRSVIGYGPESQLATLYRLTGRPDPERGRFLRDRAHNEVLDDLVTGGLVSATLWLLVMGAAVTAGVRRLRTSASGVETGIRAGCLGAVVGHLVDAQFGIATPVSMAFFWIVAALLTVSPAPDRISLDRAAPRKAGVPARWVALLIMAPILAAVVAWGSTCWLGASIVYARGSRLLNAGAQSAAHREFQEAGRLVPGLSQPAEATAGVAVALAGGERDPARQLALLGEAEAALATVRRFSSYATTGAYHWVLVGQVALGQYRGGDRSKLATALEAYETAARLRPGDSWILANWGMAWLDARNPERARQVAEQAVAQKRDNWLGWAVLARAASQLGDTTRTLQAAARARALAPPEARSLLDELVQ